jgi:hypothetical protein
MRHVVRDHAARARYREPNGMWLDGCEGVGGAGWDACFRSQAEKKDLQVRTKTPEKSGKDKCREDVDVFKNPDHELKDTQMRLGRLNVCSGQEKVGLLGSRLEDEEWACGCVDWDDERELGGVAIEIETETGKYQDCSQLCGVILSAWREKRAVWLRSVDDRLVRYLVRWMMRFGIISSIRKVRRWTDMSMASMRRI